MPDLRQSIRSALAAFAKKPLRDASSALFNELTYRSERTLAFGTVADFCATYDKANLLAAFQPTRTWQSIDLVFQLTGEDIAKGSSTQLSLLEPDPADLRKLQSYLFIAIDLKVPQDGKPRTRTALCEIARAINRLFPMPALVVFKEGDIVSIAITYRRANKQDAAKDVVSRKVTLIKDIRFAAPHPGHLAILEDFALPTLSEFRGRDIRTFADLDAAWNESLSVELLRRRAYRMLADWYFWARQHAQFPPDALPDADGKPSLHLIRLLTRVIFCWFVKEKSLPNGKPLIPFDLFDAPRIREILRDSSPAANTYYTAVLQNLFFATLNTEMDEDGKSGTRRFARKVKEDHMVHTLWRHEEQLRDPAAFANLVREVPFLNGGLFECLDDRIEIEGSNQTREIRVDGFSTNPAKHPKLPNFLFFGDDQRANLSEATGSKRSDVEVVPLLSILNRFVWTITESTPLEEEVALDPDLLGNVFENLLASYNPETGTVARNATGSFYTPDYVVDWMIDKALLPLLVKALQSDSDTDIPVCNLPTSPSITKTRRNLPHWKKDSAIYWITFRLGDSLPQEKLKSWTEERNKWTSRHSQPWSHDDWQEYDKRFGERLEEWLDAGLGSCVLARADLREVVQQCLLRFEGDRLHLHGAVIMPNHVHLLLEPTPGNDLSKLMQGIKGASARAANQILGTTGRFWMDESYDHIVRSEAQYRHFVRYIAENPVKARLSPDQFWHYQCDTDIPVCGLPPKPLPSAKSTGRNACATLESRVRRLLDWNEPGHDFKDAEITSLIECISKLRALDPACGSGAFPMGLLKKLVRVLAKLDPDNSRWKLTQVELAEQLESAPAREEALAAIERAFARNHDDYGRKLYLIENGIYGVDIQPLAVQIAKLRFFITLIVDQPTDPARPNYGILPLPNLETKIVPANTLLGLQRGQLLLGSNQVRELERDLKNVRHRYFTARRYQDKKTLRKRDRDICKQLAKALVDSGECTAADAGRLVEWNPYNTNTHAGFFDPGWMFGLEGEGGKFDLVVGNPPYVRQEELKAVMVQDSAGRQRPLKEVLKDQYECFTGTADLYVYFFEKSIQLLRVGGVLSFITSNKYFRAAYGEKLRAYLLYATAPQVILDFGNSNIFTAVAYPSILVTEKVRDVIELPDPKKFEHQSSFEQLVPHADRDFPVLAWQPGPSKIEFPEIFENDHIALSQKDLKPSGWLLESPVGLRMLERLRKGNKTLYEYCNGRVYYGLKTGYNEAFVVDRATRNQLIAEHASSAEVLKPFLRGRDVKRWRCESQDLWLVYVPWHFPLHLDPSVRGVSAKAEEKFKYGYPAIYKYLESHRDLLEARNKAETGIRYEWYALQRWGADYWQEFEQPKIVIPAIQDKVNYAPDFTNFYSNDKTSILIPPSVPFALAILNSQVSMWITQQEFASKQGGFFEFKPMYVSKLPIPNATDEQKQLCESLSAALIYLHRPEAQSISNRGLMVAYFEQWLNGLVYELFFPGELHARHLHLFDETAKPENRFPDLTNLEPVAKFERLKACFQRVYDIKHPIREMLYSLRSIEEIRIIEGES